MTEDLETLAEVALSEARRELEAEGSISVGIWLRQPDGEVQSAEIGPPFNELMNSGPAKQSIFGFVRRFVKARGITAVIIATDAWLGVPTEKQKQILTQEGGPDRLAAVFKSKSLDEVEAMGLVERQEALVVTVQTPTDVLVVNQLYKRMGKHIYFGQRRKTQTPQCDFKGRQKMYDDEEANATTD